MPRTRAGNDGETGSGVAPIAAECVGQVSLWAGRQDAGSWGTTTMTETSPETSHYGTPFGNIRLRYWPAAGASGEAGSRGRNQAEDKAEAWPTVVLVHGMFGDVDVWSATALNLARAGLSVLAADLPGHGESTAEVDSAEQAAQAIGAALDAWRDASAQAEVMQAEGSSHRAEAAGLASPLALPASCRAREGGEALQDGQQLLLVGHSFGALVASTLAASLEKMGRLAGLVLLSPSGLGEEVNRDFLLSVIEAADDGALARALEALTVKHYRSSAAYVRAMRARLQAAQAQLYRLVDDVVDITGRQSRSIVETLAGLSVPVTLVHGREDAVIPWQHALNAPPATALHLLPGIGHMPHWEAAALTTNIIIRAAAEAAGLRLAG